MEIYYYALFFLFQLCFVVQIYFLLVVQTRLAYYKTPNFDFVNLHPLSVIICGRNELANFKKNLPFILAQDYPDFEVIIVNDCSVDDSQYYLKDLAAQHPNVKIVTLKEDSRFRRGKKFAVSMGVKAAKNDILVFTDADCVPESSSWLKYIQRHYESPGVEIVLGYSPYERYAGILNNLIRFETFFTALNYLSFALYGIPYMGVGRNLSYKKELFFKGKGFAAHMHVPSGDDDLFVNQHATKNNVAIEIEKQSQQLSEPKLTWKAYWQQKNRHQGAGKLYKTKHKLILSLQAISAILFYVTLLALLILKVELVFVISVFFVRLVLQAIIFSRAMKKLCVADLIWYFPLLEPLYYFYLLLLSFAGIFKKKITWK